MVKQEKNLPGASPFTLSSPPEWFSISRPGYIGKRRETIESELNEKYGKENWRIVHFWQTKTISLEEALDLYEESYNQFLKDNNDLLEWLVTTASDVYDSAPSNIEAGLNYYHQENKQAHYQDIAIRRVIKCLGRSFSGDHLIQVRGRHAEGAKLSPGRVPFHLTNEILNPHLKGWWKKNSVEDFWQSNKILQIKTTILLKLASPLLAVLVRSDLKLGKGKFAVQASHGAVSAIFQPTRKTPWLGKWLNSSRKLEVITVPSPEILSKIKDYTHYCEINTNLIADAGMTQLPPGTQTCAALGPGPDFLIKSILHKFSI
ncbi:MAG: peptidyl-tRNA hydrolase [Promethearchaeota archaeon]